MLVQGIPGLGDAYSFLTGAIGFDPLAGVSLSGLERGLSMAAALPFVPGLSGIGGCSADDLAGLGLGQADELARARGLARAGEGVGMAEPVKMR